MKYFKFGCVFLYLELFQLEISDLFKKKICIYGYGRIRQLDNLDAVSCASTGTCGCGQVRANRLEHAFSCFFVSPSLACDIFETGELQNHGVSQL